MKRSASDWDLDEFPSMSKIMDGVGDSGGDDRNIADVVGCFSSLQPQTYPKSAFEKLDKVFATFETPSKLEKGYVFPRPKMINVDLGRIINSDGVQSVVKPINNDVMRKTLKKHPLKNLGTMLKLNPYAKMAKRMAPLAGKQSVKAKQEKLRKKRSTLTKEEAAG